MGRAGIVTGAIFGFLSVAFGAFGAHALKPFLVEHNRFDTFELAVRYQFFHALALVMVGILQRVSPAPLAAYCVGFFSLGICLFSGSLYALCFTSLGIVGLITPFGGILLLLGWAFMAVAYIRR
jgi:uncharacterized membrane protein YgdD (TMEM256/DUF423 family)